MERTFRTERTLSFNRTFSVSYYGGKRTGFKKCFKTLAGATISAKSYIKENKDIPRYVYCQIESLIYYNGRLQKRTFIKEINNKPE